LLALVIICDTADFHGAAKPFEETSHGIARQLGLDGTADGCPVLDLSGQGAMVAGRRSARFFDEVPG
jgi:hypothetical protein